MKNRFKFALEGLIHIFKKDKNIRFHFFLFVVLIVFGFIFHISKIEWLIVLLCSGVVFSLEILNSIIEKIADFIQPDIHPQIKVIKDVSAGMVLFFSIFAFLIATIIFIPKLFQL